MTRPLKATARSNSSLAFAPVRVGTPVRPIPASPEPGTRAAPVVTANVTGQTDRGFAERLRMYLAARRISGRQLAQQCGVNHSTISRLLRGQRLPTLETAVKLARVLPDLRYGPDGTSHVGNPSFDALSPIARIEYVLRSDDRLDESQIREIIDHYLALREGRQYQRRVKRVEGEAIVPEAPGANSPVSPAPP